MKSNAGISVTSTRGMLEVLQRHYPYLRKISVDSDFDANWKREVESKGSSYGNLTAYRVCLFPLAHPLAAGNCMSRGEEH